MSFRPPSPRAPRCAPAAALRAAAVAGALVLLVHPARLAADPAHGGQVLAELPCPVDEPTGMTVAADGAHLWISDLASRSLVRVRIADGTVVERLEAGGLRPTGLALRGGTLYAADRLLETIARRRPGGAQPDLAPIPYYERWAGGLAHDGAHLWVVDQRDAKLHELDPGDGTTIASFDAPGPAPTGLAFDGRYLWVADHKSDELYMVDRRDGAVILAVPSPGPYPSALAATPDSLWVADYQTRRLHQLALPGGTPYVEDQERRVHASYELALQARGTGRVVNLVAYLAVPRDLPGQHVLSPLAFDPAPTRLETDVWGQALAVFELGALAPGETARVSWQGDFALFRTRFQLLPERVGAVPRDPALAPYLGDDVKYDLGSPVVARVVEEVTRGKTGTYDRARALYEHLTRVIAYDRSGGWNNAAAVLARGTGSCSEYTFALVALLRKAGIPARTVGAISERGDEASFDDVFHRWAEAYLPGYGWVPLDANAGTGKTPAERGAFFGGRSNRHVVTTIVGGGTRQLGWGYNHDVTYGVEGGATLDVQPLGRLRPIPRTGDVEPHVAARVLVPRLVEPVPTVATAAPVAAAPEGPGRARGGGRDLLGDAWSVVGLAIALGVGAGILQYVTVRRRRRRRAGVGTAGAGPGGGAAGGGPTAAA